MKPHKIIEAIAEETGEIVAEVAKAPFKIIGSFFDNIFP